MNVAGLEPAPPGNRMVGSGFIFSQKNFKFSYNIEFEIEELSFVSVNIILFFFY